jgi:hypothetical protein
MIVTCSLEPVEEAPEAQVAIGSEPQSAKNQIPGQATCTHCGNEAEILEVVSKPQIRFKGKARADWESRCSQHTWVCEHLPESVLHPNL